MDTLNGLLRKLPKIDDIMRTLAQDTVDIPPVLIKNAAQERIELWRQEILDKRRDDVDEAVLLAKIRDEIAQRMQPSLRRVINATGVILHTNLGRARLSPEAIQAVCATAEGYANLEYDLDKAERGSRYEHVETLLTQLTGAEAALVVNNNAAAVYLVLDALAKGGEVIVSRGELVEIGGSFRIPDIMARSGCHLLEVGTTNKTHAADYAEQINENTAALLKVHTSNYRIVGFTEDVSLPALWQMGKENDIPVIYDLGSGLLLPLKDYGVRDEPTVADCVPYADILCFSGDKLLGGPQAGILLGRKEFIDRMKKNHLLRALRIDKLTLAVLEQTLRQYLDMNIARETIPTLRMITMKAEEVEAKVDALLQTLQKGGRLHYEKVETKAQIGGGSLPGVELPSYALSVWAEDCSAQTLETKLRKQNTPVIARLMQERVLLDMRTVSEDEGQVIVACLNEISL